MIKKFEDKRKVWKEQILKSFEIVNKNNYRKLDVHIKDKKIVLLGENTHWAGEFYTAKIDIIKHLHHHHGFNTVILESSLMESIFWKGSNKKEDLASSLENYFLGIYINEEALPLFKDRELTDIDIVGMDIQSTTRTASQTIIDWVSEVDSQIGTVTALVESLYFEIDDFLKLQKKLTKEIREKIKVIIKMYADLLARLDGIDKRKLSSNDYKKFHIFQRGMLNRQQWLKVNLEGRISSGSLRDTYMFENVKWIMNFLGLEKVIIWSHNYHIRKDRSRLLKLLRIQTIGSLLTKSYPDDIFSIGLYAGSGTCLSPYGDEYEIIIEDKHHLELLLLELEQPLLLLPINYPNQDKKRRKHWSNQYWWLLETRFLGMAPYVGKPRKIYDAILFLKRVNPPKKL